MVLLTWFEDFIFHVAPDVVGVLLTVEEAILGLAQGAAGDISSTADRPDNSNSMNQKSASCSQNSCFSYYHSTDWSPDFGLWLQGHRWLLDIGVNQPSRECQAVARTVGKQAPLLKMQGDLKDSFVCLVAEGTAPIRCVLPGEHRK